MPYQVEETGKYSRVASVTVPAEEFQRDFHKALRELAKKVKMPGFRKGHVPLSVMRRNYGNSVMGEVIDRQVNTRVNELVRQTPSVLWIKQPELVGEVSPDHDLTFTVQFEVKPSIDPVGYVGLDVERPSAEISEEELSAELEALRQQQAKLMPVEQRAEIADGDVVTLDFRAIGEGEAYESFRGEGVDLEVGSGQALPGFEDALRGQSFDATVIAKVTTPEQFPIGELAGQEIEVELVVKAVNARVLPELDDAFAEATGEAKTLAELRSALRGRMQSEREQQADKIVRANAVDALIKQNPVEVPPEFLGQQVSQSLRQELEYMMQQRLSPELLGLNPQDMVATIQAQRERQIKAEFVLSAVASKEKLRLEDADYRRALAQRAEALNASAVAYERFLRSKPEEMEAFKRQALLEKAIDFLVSGASIKEVPWGAQSSEEQVVEAASEEAAEAKPARARARKAKKEQAAQAEDAQIEASDAQE